MAGNIQVNTAQNVNLEYAVASVGDRILAYLLDLLITLAVFAALFGVSYLFAEGVVFGIAAVISVLIYTFYDLLFEIFNNGQTPGKKALQIQVVTLEGRQPTIGSYILRWLFRIVDFQMLTALVGIICIASSEKGQRVGDIIAKTTVIKLTLRNNLSQTIFERIDENYIPRYPSVVNLRSDDILIIKDILNAAPSTQKNEALFKLTEKVEGLLSIQKQQQPYQFLKTILADYNYYQSQE